MRTEIGTPAPAPVAHAVTTSEARPGRMLGLDVLKGAAISLVIFNHALLWPMRSGDRPAAFAYGIAFGTVAAFTGVAGYLRGLRPPASERALLLRRARQLLLPWALFAPVYAAAPFAWRLLGGGNLPMGFEPEPWVREILLGGGPLWFLPVLFFSQAVCTPLIRRTRGWWPALVAIAVYSVTATLAAMHNVSPLELGGGTFWAVSPLYVAAFWFGLRIAQDGTPKWPKGAEIAVIVTTMVAGGAVTLARAMVPDLRWLMWLPYAIGLAGGCAALVYAVSPARARDVSDGARRAGRMLARAGSSSLGLYIIHPVLVGPAAVLLSGRGGVPAAVLITVGVVASGTLIVEWFHRAVSPANVT